MLRIWGRPNSINVQKVMWVVGELGLEHERLDAGGQFGKNDTAEYAAMNPNRLIPVLEDGDRAIWESNAIVRYLAARYGAGSLWPEDPGERALADQWMDWQVSVLQPATAPVFIGLVRTPPDQRDQVAIAQGTERLVAAMRLLDGHLAQRRFVAGDRLTMGDVPVGCACWRYRGLEIARPELPHLDRWFGQLEQREAYQRHVMIPLT